MSPFFKVRLARRDALHEVLARASRRTFTYRGLPCDGARIRVCAKGERGGRSVTAGRATNIRRLSMALLSNGLCVKR